jgi:hypothetical protein
MGALAEEFEIVRVTRPFQLIDSEGLTTVYWRRDGVPLPSGIDVVCWPPRAKTRTFNEDVSFRGPFRTQRAAETACEELAAKRARRLRAFAVVQSER